MKTSVTMLDGCSVGVGSTGVFSFDELQAVRTTRSMDIAIHKLTGVTLECFFSLLVIFYTVIISTTSTDMLSSPPAELAASTSWSQAACGELASRTI